MAATPVMAFVIEYIRTIVSGLYAPQVSRKTTLPFRAMSPEAPFSRPVVICSCITVLMRFRRSREKPACSGAAVGKLAPTGNDVKEEPRLYVDPGVIGRRVTYGFRKTARSTAHLFAVALATMVHIWI